MNKMRQYLEEKNMYLEKFLGLNREWLDKLNQGDFSAIDEFRETRENLLNIIKHLDNQIEGHLMSLEMEEGDDALRKEIGKLLDRKDALVKVILAQDLDIMQIVESAKAVILKELRRVTKHRSYRASLRRDLIDEEA